MFNVVYWKLVTMSSNFGKDTLAVDEIIEILPGLHENICEQMDIFVNNHRQNAESLPRRNPFSFDCNAGDFKNINDLKEINLKNSEFLESIQVKIKHLESKKKNTEQVISECEVELKSLASKKSKLNDTMTSYLEKRNCIQACKLLTNTNFVYGTHSTSGYVFCPDNEQIKPFEFSAKQSQKEITAALYDVIKTVCDSSNPELALNEVNKS